MESMSESALSSSPSPGSIPFSLWLSGYTFSCFGRAAVCHWWASEAGSVSLRKLSMDVHASIVKIPVSSSVLSTPYKLVSYGKKNPYLR